MYAEAGLFAPTPAPRPARAEEVLSLLRGASSRTWPTGPRSREFERAKGHVKGSLVLSLEDPGGRMSRLGKSEIGHGEILTVDQMLGRIDAVTPEDAARVAERVLLAADDADRARPVRPRRQGRHRVIRVGVIGACGRMGRRSAGRWTTQSSRSSPPIDRSRSGERSGR